jgi:predicted small secreted protein
MKSGNRAIRQGIVIKFVAASLLLMQLCACNTMAGLGKDVESLGGAIEKSADKAKK